MITISNTVAGCRCISWTKDSIGNAIGIGLCCFVIEYVLEYTSYFRLPIFNYEFKNSWSMWNSLHSKDCRSYIKRVDNISSFCRCSLINKSHHTLGTRKINFEEIWGKTYNLIWIFLSFYFLWIISTNQNHPHICSKEWSQEKHGGLHSDQQTLKKIIMHLKILIS